MSKNIAEREELKKEIEMLKAQLAEKEGTNTNFTLIDEVLENEKSIKEDDNDSVLNSNYGQMDFEKERIEKDKLEAEEFQRCKLEKELRDKEKETQEDKRASEEKKNDDFKDSENNYEQEQKANCSAESHQNKRLYRSREDTMLSGVCGGIAEYFDVDPTLVRLGFVGLSILTTVFPGLTVYIIMSIVIPKRP